MRLRALCAVCALLAGGRAGAQTVSDAALEVRAVVPEGSLSLPTSMAFVAPADILVLEKETGRVRRVVDGAVSPVVALDLHVSATSERGLLGIAVNTESPPRVFLYVTEAAGADGGAPLGNRVYRYTWNAASGLLEAGQLLLDLPVLPGPNHDGGVLTLGPVPAPAPGQVGDGAVLYGVIGDLNRDGQLQNRPGGPPPDDTGVIFAVRQDGSPAPGNPFVPYCSGTTTQTCPTGTGCPGGEACRTAVARYFAYGVRNSFGLAVDPATGALWQTENGPASYDEVNRVPAGLNSGWDRIMGPDARDPQGPGDLFAMPGGAAAYSDPEFSWLETIAPTAIVFPVSSALGPAYDGVALVGDANLGQLYALPLDAAREALDPAALPPGLQDLVADTAAERNALRIGEGFGGVTDLEIGPDGALYVVGIGAGTIYRVGPAGATTTSTSVPPGPDGTTSTTLPPPACPPAPDACRAPAVSGAARLALRDAAVDVKDRLVWRWLRGARTDAADFGDPAARDAYALCVYDASALVLDAVVPAGGDCAGRPCWTRGPRGLVYRDRRRARDGFRRIVLRPGAERRARIVVKAGGPALGLPGLASLASPVTVQLRNATACWGARYSFPPAARADARRLRDRAD